jgi:hypothetical protein
VVQDRTRLLNRRLRILKTVVEAEGQELVVVASHWTSRLTDKTGASRAKYADQIHGDFRGMFKANPNIAYLVCGDFNDNPDDPSVTEHLRATGDLVRVKKSDDPPYLFNPFALLYKGESGDVGSLYFGKKSYVFDNICLSPGLLRGQGWTYVDDSARIVRLIAQRNGRPNRFGGPHDKRAMSERGASDHFPVTVRLKINK